MARLKFWNGEEEKVLNKCPVCGEKLEYSALYQYEVVFGVTKSGKLTKNRKRKCDVGSMECGYIICTNEDCDFRTNCDLDVEDNNGINVFHEGEVFMYTETELE